ncbi:histidine phosphatase family protein [Pseudaeromonas sharmana]|uniref:Histidine phosphatase family protein n=1 Tax=Pseudaeromonas sharmana TaxID=328412 RepID=A0ABV8CQX5_9GAMM
MLQLHLFRHGESAANAGLVTSQPAEIPLTPRGEQQAMALAHQLTFHPDLILCSPFLRARQTAAPCCARFPTVPLLTLPIQEFTYLAPARCAATDAATRRPLVDAYWQRADPRHVDGDGAESFVDLLNRVRQLLLELQQSDASEVALFGHGQFMQALRWHLHNAVPLHAEHWQPERLEAEQMRAFRRFDLAHPIANAAGFTCRWSLAGWRLG